MTGDNREIVRVPRGADDFSTPLERVPKLWLETR